MLVTLHGYAAGRCHQALHSLSVASCCLAGHASPGPGRAAAEEVNPVPPTAPPRRVASTARARARRGRGAASLSSTDELVRRGFGGAPGAVEVPVEENALLARCEHPLGTTAESIDLKPSAPWADLHSLSVAARRWLAHAVAGARGRGAHHQGGWSSPRRRKRPRTGMRPTGCSCPSGSVVTAVFKVASGTPAGSRPTARRTAR